MADRGLIHYQPVTGPVWREPVASRMAWLPRGEPARPLERRVPSEFVYPPFYELYNPAGLHWLPSGRWPLYPEVRKLGDFQQPPFQALYKPEQLGWMPSAYYVGRAAPRGTPDLTVFPIQFGVAPAYDPKTLEWMPSDRLVGRSLPYSLRQSYTVAAVSFDSSLLSWQHVDRYLGRALPRGSLDGTVFPIQFVTTAFNPQNLEWIPKGIYLQVPVERRVLGDFQQPPFDALYKPERLEWTPKGINLQVPTERRILGDFVQPAFDALYKPEGLQWLFEGQLSVRGIPYTLQSSWIVDPKPVVTVAFDPQFFPFQATDIVLSRGLQAAIQSGYATPPLPPGPDVIPPVVAPGLGGSSATHPRRVVYEKGTKRKPKTFIDRIGEPFLDLEKTPEPVPDAASAGAVVDTSKIRASLAARLPAPLAPSISTPLVAVRSSDEDDDDDLLLLS